jgi:hypothetical protein
LVGGPAGEACLQVTNPNAPILSERVLCRRTPDQHWLFTWPWRQAIGGTHQITEVADAIANVLREVEP